MGTLNIVGIDDVSQVDTATAESKFWNVVQYKIADYKFNNETDLLPVFNEGFTYTYEDIIEDNITHRLLYADTLPESISFAGSLNLIECGYLALDNVTSFSQAFSECSNLELIDGTNWNVSNITTFDMAFCYCEKLTNIIGIENWNTPNLGMGSSGSRALVATFGYCQSIEKINLSNWEINYNISANSTFTFCTKTTEIFLPKKFSVINILGMFKDCHSLEKIHGLEKITTLTSGSNRRPFENCYKLKEVNMPYLDASAATRLDTMFNNCTSLESIDFSHIKISDDCIVSTFFNNCTSLKSIKISSNSLSIIQKLISQLPSNNSGTFIIIGANSILSELKELLSTTNWIIVPIGPKLCELKVGNKSAHVLSSGSKMSCIVVGKLNFKD
jgi:hypothetical protein